MWETLDEKLQFMAVPDAITLGNALLCGDVSAEWLVWSCAAENAFVEAFRFAGGLVSDGRLVLVEAP